LDQSSKVIVKKEIQQIEYHSEWAIINTIVQNLIENAIKYSRKEIEPFVDIKIFTEQDQLIIHVEDNGQGIPEKNVGLIFDMFYRANNKVQGSGLGLYILKRAVERLQGTIDVKSTLHIGSVFKVRLPLLTN
ncbi:MAG TPA: ATP-binding protein, partial [Cyclobacteriaceae bacterium]